MAQSKEERAAYMREYGKRRVRTPESRREEYRRNIKRTQARYEAEKDSEKYARKVIAAELGVSGLSIPDDLAAAKLLQIQLHRAVREKEAQVQYPALVEAYLAGRTARQLAAEFGFDSGRVSKIIRAAGITMKRRPVCSYGHEMTDGNTRYTPQGWRKCRACDRRRTAEHAKRKGEALANPPALQPGVPASTETP